MSEQTASKVPQIRFKGFEGEWAQKMLGALANVTTGKLDANAMTSDGIYDFYTSGIKKYKINVAAFAGPAITIAGNGATVGYMHLADGKFNAYQRTYVLTNFITDRSFVFYSTGLRLPKKISEEARTGNIPYIVMDMLTELELSIPSLVEQTQIGKYFRELDGLIGLHQRKHDKLVTLKKAMLQKMFPQPGATTPEIRFKGFEGEWGEKKLGEMFNYERPDPYIVKSSEYSNENRIPVLTANKAFILGYTNETRTFNKPCIVFDDFTLEAKFVNFPFMVKSSAIKLLTIQDVEIDDLYFAFLTLNNASIELMGHARHYIGVVQPTQVRRPEIVEQQKIGTYFRTLDELISQHATQLQKLQQIKSACLERMFV